MGRTDSTFISAGENIDPLEIEIALKKIKNIHEARVLPVENKKLGAIACAFINGEFNEDETKKELTQSIHPYKIPKLFFHYPKNFSGIKPSLNDFKLILKKEGLTLAK